MKKITRIFTALLAMCPILFAGCQVEELTTDQYAKDEVALNAYGPQPVARGGQLRFIGSNLDKVVSIIIPGVDPVTDIEVVQAGIPSEIRITVPKDGPEPGLLTLVTQDGKEITTKTELTYSEPIELAGFSPSSVKPGDELTITGDYLNLIHEVVFPEDVLVSEKDFTSHSRYEIKVIVPETACTGPVAIGDLDELNNEDPSLFANIIYSEKELVVAQPEVTDMSAARWKAGETVTVTGNNFAYVSYVKFTGTEVNEFDVNEAATELTFPLPAEAGDGEVFLVAKSGVEIRAGEMETVVPSELSVSPEPVKQGNELAIEGKDLDLVTTVTLPSSGDAEYAYEEGKITFDIPETAQEGDIVLAMANAKTVTVSYALVKPVVAAYSSNPAAAGSEITISGTDLDLVKSITFGGGLTVDVEAGADEITVAVPTTAETGAVAFNLANGTSVAGPELGINKPEACYVTELPSSGTEIYGGTVLVLPVANGDKLTGVQVNGSDVNYLINNTSLYISLPEMAGKGTSIKLVSSNGTVDYTIDCIPNNVTNRVIWSGSWDCGSWSGNQDLAWGAFDWSTIDLSQGSNSLVVELELDNTQSFWQFALRSGASWGELPENSLFELSAGQTELVIPFTQAMLDDIKANNGLVITGCHYTLKKITLKTEISLETVAWEGNIKLTWSAGGRVVVPASVFESCSAGDEINFYFDQITETWGQAQLNYADFSGMVFSEIGSNTLVPTDIYGWSFSSRCLTCVLTQEILDNILAKRQDCDDEGAVDCGMIIQGDNVIFTKITIE